MAQQCIHELQSDSCVLCNGYQAKVKRVPAAERYADAIFDLIPVEGWISQADLAEASGLEGGQVASGVAYLRDNYPELPLVSGRQGYGFTLNEADVNTFRLARTRSALTIYRRTFRGAVKPYLDTQGPMEARLITKQFERLIEDLEEMTA